MNIKYQIIFQSTPQQYKKIESYLDQQSNTDSNYNIRNKRVIVTKQTNYIENIIRLCEV